jgi:DNA repair protein RecN (Recombination protein N)
MRFQFEEINKAQLEDGEQETIEQETEQLSHSEEIKEALYDSDNALMAETNGAVEQVKIATTRLQNIENVFHSAKELAERLSNCHIELKDIAQEISHDVENVDFDPNRLNDLNQRLDYIYSLEQKFHVNSIAELLAIRDDLKSKLENIDNSDDTISEIQHKVDTLCNECKSKSIL